jgi:hypothetical protein
MADEPDYIELGSLCANVCRALAKGTKGKKSEELSPPVHCAIDRLKL